MGAISVDESRFPLVRIQLDGKQSTDEVEALLDDFGRLLGGSPYLALVEIRDYKTDFDHVKSVARWTLAHLDDVRRSVAGAVLIIPSDLFRLMLSTFMLITPLPVPFHVTTDAEEATAWIADQARTSGLEVRLP